MKKRGRIYDMVWGHLKAIYDEYSPYWGTEHIPPSSVYHYLKFGAYDVHLEIDLDDELCTMSVFKHNKIYLNQSKNVFEILELFSERLKISPGPIPREDFISHGFKDIGLGQYRLDGDVIHYVVSWAADPNVYKLDEVRDPKLYPKEIGTSYSQDFWQGDCIESLKSRIMAHIY